MRKFYTILVITSLFYTPYLFAQASTGIEALEEKYGNFFELNRENVFMHLNKTAVIPEEDLWLTVYVYNSKLERPHLETANLEVRIFRKNGEHVDTKTLYIMNGKGAGYINLDKEIYSQGEYFLQATTNYMKNFTEDHSFVQPFTILAQKVSTSEENISYDLQVLPEGGHLLSQSLNTVGVKMIDNTGAGSQFVSGRVLNSGGEEVTRFESNRHGLSKFTFIPLPNEKYEVVVESEIGKKIRQSLPPANEKGITLTNTIRNDEHLITVKTNEHTFEEVKNTQFILSVHKDGNVKNLEFQFPENELEFHIRMKKDSLLPGVNTVTVFDENLNPLVERLIFSRNNLKRSSILASQLGRTEDSVKVALWAQDAAAGASLSISILPTETQAYDPEHNIISAFHLKPYIQGHINEPAYYFSPGEEERKEYDLDLLLLSQGWSKYDWKDIFENPPKEIYEHIVGYNLEGQVSNRNEKRHKNIMIRSDDSGIFSITDIGTDDRFAEERLFLIDSTELKFSLVNEKNSKVSIPLLNVSIFPEKEIQNLDESFSFPKRKTFHEIPALPEVFAATEYELDTVNLSTKIERRDFGQVLMVHERGYKITEEIAQQFNHIADYIATKGFLVSHVNGWVEIKSTYITTIGGSGSGSGETTARGAHTNVMMYLNGVPMGHDASFITALPTAQVESIIINKHGFGQGIHGPNGVIHINTKKGGVETDDRKTVKTIIANNGFTRYKEFYVPRYKVVNNSAYLKYGVVDWKPSVLLDDEGKAEILISKSGPVSLFIEGMNAQGVLLSEIITLE